jgi:hypothetical protein
MLCLEKQVCRKRKLCMIVTRAMRDPYIPPKDELKTACEESSILWKPEDVFAYLQDYNLRERQISMF